MSALGLTLAAALADCQESLVERLGQWYEANPDGDIRVWMKDLSAADRERVRRAHSVACGTPVGGWITGP